MPVVQYYNEQHYAGSPTKPPLQHTALSYTMSTPPLHPLHRQAARRPCAPRTARQHLYGIMLVPEPSRGTHIAPSLPQNPPGAPIWHPAYLRGTHMAPSLPQNPPGAPIWHLACLRTLQGTHTAPCVPQNPPGAPIWHLASLRTLQWHRYGA